MSAQSGGTGSPTLLQEKGFDEFPILVGRWDLTAGDVYGFLKKIGGDRFAGKVVKALAETFYDQSHYERGIEAYERLLKLDPTSRDPGLWVMQIAAGDSPSED